MEKQRHGVESEFDFRQLDLLPFGAILVDQNGIVHFFNESEERETGRERTDVLGRNFFTEIAPCAQVRQFHDEFRRTVGDTGSIAAFEFSFPTLERTRIVSILMTSFRYKGEVLCLITVGDLS